MTALLMSLCALPLSIVPYSWLLDAALFFACLVGCITLFIVVFLYRHSKQQQKKKQLRLLFSDLIAETTICETEEECRTTLQQFLAIHRLLVAKPFSRRVLTREIVKANDSISGGASQNLRWLFETLELDKDTLKRFLSKQWHQKASAIQHLAEMQQHKYRVKIYRETNSKNSLVRSEAQIAVVKLTGFKGLRFLNIVSYPVSQWQQLSLISQLQEGEIEEAKIEGWLLSKNDSVVEFALRLAEVYKCYDLHDAVLKSLQHPSLSVRLQALRALKEISNETTARAFVQHFSNAGKREQEVILDTLTGMEAGNRELHFFTTLLRHSDEAIRYRALSAIQQCSPAWSSVVLRHIKDNPSFTYILSSLQKKAV